MRNYSKQLYTNRMDNLEEMDKLLERCNLPGLNQDEVENVNRPVANDEIEYVVKTTSKNKSPRAPDGFTSEFY